MHAQLNEILIKLEEQESSAVMGWIVLTCITGMGLFVSCIVMIMLSCGTYDEPRQSPRAHQLKDEIEAELQPPRDTKLDMTV